MLPKRLARDRYFEYYQIMSKKKIFNDPVYGFVSFPYGIVFELIEHPYFQRLRRIRQLGLTDFVYPGALHTRFHHALGALHLMTQAIEVLKSKGVAISPEEAEAVSIAILLHDIGHGPISHALEHTLVNVHHEDISVLFMEELNEQFAGRLSLAIEIFENRYPKKFLYQLISGQLDMDRMDYLNRDSFFTGVSEGVIGYDRIIKMLAVKDGELMVEEKGIYSIEKFLIARRLMYWQVYLHKTVLAAEQMLIKTLRRAKMLAMKGVDMNVQSNLNLFLTNDFRKEDFEKDRFGLLNSFASLDDVDIIAALKQWEHHEDELLAYLSKCLLQRKLFKVEIKNSPFSSDYVEKIRRRLIETPAIRENESLYDLIITGKESNSTYSTSKEEIKILFKNGQILPMSEASDQGINPKIITKYYLCYPKNIN